MANINREVFENFLNLLDAKNREAAGQMYEDMRLRLIVYFRNRRCYMPEDMADESLDRVMKKIFEMEDGYEGEPIRYCYGVARNVLLEYTREARHFELLEKDFIIKDMRENPEDIKFMNECLKKLKPEERELFESYYLNFGKAKDERKKLEDDYQITNINLRARVFRIRENLQKCIFKLQKA